MKDTQDKLKKVVEQVRQSYDILKNSADPTIKSFRDTVKVDVGDLLLLIKLQEVINKLDR
jgi:hypothetical protein